MCILYLSLRGFPKEYVILKSYLINVRFDDAFLSVTVSINAVLSSQGEGTTGASRYVGNP